MFPWTYILGVNPTYSFLICNFCKTSRPYPRKKRVEGRVGSTLQNSREVKSPISPHLEAQPSESGGRRVPIKSVSQQSPQMERRRLWCSLGFAIAESSKPSGNCHHPSATNPTLMITNGKIRGKKNKKGTQKLESYMNHQRPTQQHRQEKSQRSRQKTEQSVER